MIIVSDTTPFRSLIEIDVVDILAILFGQVLIPEAVADYSINCKEINCH